MQSVTVILWNECSDFNLELREMVIITNVITWIFNGTTSFQLTALEVFLYM